MYVTFVIVPFIKSKDLNVSTRTVVTGLPLLKFPKLSSRFDFFESAIPAITYKHLGLGYIAAGLKAANHKVSLIDGQALGISLEEVLEMLQKEMPDVVAIPNFIGGRLLVYELVKEIHEALPDVHVVLGGPQVTLYPHQVFKECPELTLGLCGEADFTMTDLVDCLEKGVSFDHIPGIVRRKNSGELIFGPPPETITDLDTIPFPDRELYDRRLYNPIPMMLTFPQMKAEQAITSRGCDWHSCRFCYQSIDQMPCYRRRSPENVIEELRRLVGNYGIEFVVFTDDSFLRDEPWIEHFCQLLDESDLDLKWSVIGRVNSVTPSMLRRIARSGCVHVAYGLESGNQETLDMLNKGTSLEQARDAVRWAHEAGLVVRGYIMFGLPRETLKMTRKTLRFVIDLDVDYITIAPYHILEGTPLEELALREGTVVCHDNVTVHMPSYIPDTYENGEQINRMIVKAYRRFYFRPRFIVRVLWKCRRPRMWPGLLAKVWVGLHIVFQKKE